MMDDKYIRKATVVNVHDGDTMTVDLDLGYYVTTRLTLRLYRINAPELSVSAGKVSRDVVQSFCPVGSEITIQTFKNPGDKYGRWLAEIFFMYRGEVMNLNDYLVLNGYAVYYNGVGPK